MVCLDEPRGAESLGYPLEILLNFGPGGVEGGPVRVGGEGVLVRVGCKYELVFLVFLIERSFSLFYPVLLCPHRSELSLGVVVVR